MFIDWSPTLIIGGMSRNRMWNTLQRFSGKRAPSTSSTSIDCFRFFDFRNDATSTRNTPTAFSRITQVVYLITALICTFYCTVEIVNGRISS
ncbi:hypothetical protein CEXT_261471 [Caerostris extrusa]|uniref:Uncharacterized protein n=1 Tax=Caerostris extrusa TaxID=172846 RepID=A0AAV4QQ12_CAEEX|nr:hypothetical protein CEXT_261471 [Caerostris extrusa]